jgi:hypothetical protein
VRCVADQATAPWTEPIVQNRQEHSGLAGRGSVRMGSRSGTGSASDSPY